MMGEGVSTRVGGGVGGQRFPCQTVVGGGVGGGSVEEMISLTQAMLDFERT